MRPAWCQALTVPVDTPRRDGLVRGAESQDRLDLDGGAQCDGVAAVEACLVPVHLGEREDLASGIAGAAGADGGPDVSRDIRNCPVAVMSSAR